MNYIMQPYDDALQYILDNGVKKSNRTGIDTISVFGYNYRINISEKFPILTKRKLYPKAVFNEVLWFLSGSTNVIDLEKSGSKIWSAWRDKEFAEKNNYSFENGTMGPLYGFQFRYFGGNYDNKTAHKQGFDQLNYLVNELKNNKSSRRIVFSFWDPATATSNAVRLPPCPIAGVFNVTGDKLSCMLFQRSCDAPIGAPTSNLFFASSLTYMLAQQCDLKPFEVIHSIADFHIYENQIDLVKEYLSRPQIESPTLTLNKAKDIFSYTIDDFQINDYNPLSYIKFPVAV